MKRLSVKILFIVCLSFVIEAYPQKLPDLIPFRFKDKWGYSDKSKSIKIKAIYEDVYLFQGEFALVVNKGYGVIDKNGKEVVHCTYTNGFYEDNKIILEKDERYFQVLAFENEVKLQSFEYKDNFHEGMDIYDSYGLMNPQSQGITSDSIALFILRHGRYYNDSIWILYYNSKVGALDKTGKLIVPFEYDEMSPFFSGVAGAKKGKKWGLVDKKGKVISDFTYDNLLSWDGNIFSVEKDGKYGALNSKGEVIIPLIYESSISFNKRELAYVKLDGKYGYIDKSGIQYWED